eukprot:557518-Heterocapsa_arctica.AAC.1
MVKKPDLTKVPKMDPRWSCGLWLGRIPSSDEHIVGTANGIVYGRSCRRLAAGEVPEGMFEAM